MAKAVTLKNSNGDELYPTTIAELVNGLDEKLQDVFFYKPGDTLTLSSTNTAPINGLLTGSNGSIWLNIPVKKRLDNITSATCTSFTSGIRCNNTYLGGANNYDFYSNSTNIEITVDKQTNTLCLKLIRSSGWGGTNNTAISAGNTDARFTFS